MKTTNKILIIDLEATCWEGNPPKGQENEIIEIGACLLDIETGTISKNKGILIAPEYSKVSPFCTQLTTITQEMLDEKGISLEDANDILREEYDSENYTWASYGAYDLNMVKRQCTKFKIDYPFADDHINVKALFSEIKGLRKEVGMGGALKMLNFKLEGTHHRGVDDARNIAKILHWCLQQKQI
jgi:inhibitor of KinA sporulation pathway (predicted exonuclease)